MRGVCARIQSRRVFKSIDPRRRLSFSARPWSFGHSCKNATTHETKGFVGFASPYGKPVDNALDAVVGASLPGVRWYLDDLLYRDRNDTGGFHRQLVGRLRRHIDQQFGAYRTAIGDAHDDRAAIGEICDPDQ
jgi:hypothetical protein